MTKWSGDEIKEKQWKFPISKEEPKNLVVTLRLWKTDPWLRCAVQIRGLQRPKFRLPPGGPCYIGEETKDPVLYMMSQRVLDALELAVKSSKDDKPALKNFAIYKEYNWSHDSSDLTVQCEDLDASGTFGEFFDLANSTIEHYLPEIEKTVALCAKHRPSLAARIHAIDTEEGHRLHTDRKLAEAAGTTVEAYRESRKRYREKQKKDGGVPPRS